MPHTRPPPREKTRRRVFLTTITHMRGANSLAEAIHSRRNAGGGPPFRANRAGRFPRKESSRSPPYGRSCRAGWYRVGVSAPAAALIPCQRPSG
jgi:hypothetical protein